MLNQIIEVGINATHVVLPVFSILDELLEIDNSPVEEWKTCQVWAIEYGQDNQFYYGIRPIGSNQPLKFVSEHEICYPQEAEKIYTEMNFDVSERIKMIEAIGWNEPALNLF